MERVTTNSILGGWTLKVPRQAAVDRLAAYEDTNCTPEQISDAIQSAEKLISTMRNNKKAALWLGKYGGSV